MNPVKKILGVFEDDHYDVDDKCKCGCGSVATHSHNGEPCCGGMMCCPNANR